jgi:hypothetical protein
VSDPPQKGISNRAAGLVKECGSEAAWLEPEIALRPRLRRARK